MRKPALLTITIWNTFLEVILPPLLAPGNEPSDAILVTAAGLYVHEVPHTSTLRSLSW